MLSHEQVRFFQTNGYFKLKGVLNRAETAELRDFVMREKQAETLRRQSINDGRPVVKLYGLYDRNSELMDRLVKHPSIVQPLTSLLGPNVLLVKNRHNHASVNDSESTKQEARLHRDILQPTRGIVTAVVYLEESTIENGCTNIVPGSQFLPYVGVPQPDGGGTWMDEHEEFAGLLGQALPVPMPEGGVLFFNGLAFHGVGLNTTNKTRSSITLGYRSVDELEYAPDAKRQLLVAGQHIYRGNDR